jgi:hypothetical protein
MDLLAKIFWTVLVLESAWVLLIISSFFPATPKDGLTSPDGLLVLMMFGGVALAIGVVALVYLGSLALWFHSKHSPFALAVLVLPVLFMLANSGPTK